MKLLGTNTSPYVSKVRLVLQVKNISSITVSSMYYTIRKARDVMGTKPYISMQRSMSQGGMGASLDDPIVCRC